MSQKKTGFIKLSRSIRNHWIYDSSLNLKLWIDLLLLAQFKTSSEPVILGRKEMYLKQGEILMSQKNWAEKMKVSRKKVSRFLKKLQDNDMITKLNKPPQATLIKINNYRKWQGHYDPKSDTVSVPVGVPYKNNYNNGYNEKVKLFTYKCDDCDYTKASEYYDLIQSCPHCKTTLTKGEPIYQESSL